MKTKIIFLIIAFKVLTASTSFAQEKAPAIYLKVYGGYSIFSPGSDNISQNEGQLSDPNVNGPFKQSKPGAGSGPTYGFGIATPISKLWILGIDANYLNGSKLTFTQKGTVATTDNSATTANGSHSVLSIIPNISFKVLPMPNYFIYTKLGLMFAVKTKSNYAFDDTFGNNTSEENISTDNQQFKYGLDLGLQAAAGIQFKLTKRISGFCELTGNFLTVHPTSELEKTTNIDTDPNGPSFFYTYHITYQKGTSSGTVNRQTETTTNGNVQTNIVTETGPTFNEHINSIVLNVGILVGFK